MQVFTFHDSYEVIVLGIYSTFRMYIPSQLVAPALIVLSTVSDAEQYMDALAGCSYKVLPRLP
jgi:hypothetical protein